MLPPPNALLSPRLRAEPAPGPAIAPLTPERPAPRAPPAPAPAPALAPAPHAYGERYAGSEEEQAGTELGGAEEPRWGSLILSRADFVDIEACNLT